MGVCNYAHSPCSSSSIWSRQKSSWQVRIKSRQELILLVFSSNEIIMICLQENPTTCIAEGYLIQFSYSSAMFWLSSMSIDIHRGFRMGQLSLNLAPKKKSLLGFLHPKFKWYAICSWGAPALVIMITVMMEALPRDMDIVRPGIGKGSCFLEKGLATLVYLQIICAPLMVRCKVLALVNMINT